MIQGYPHDLGNIHMCRPTCFHPSPNPLRQVEHADHGGRMPLAMCELQKRGALLHLRLDYNNYYYYYKLGFRVRIETEPGRVGFNK